jgi:hypothetical protein
VAGGTSEPVAKSRGEHGLLLLEVRLGAFVNLAGALRNPVSITVPAVMTAVSPRSSSSGAKGRGFAFSSAPSAGECLTKA